MAHRVLIVLVGLVGGVLRLLVFASVVLAESGSGGPCVVRETASYRVTYGLFGQVAEASVSLVPEMTVLAGQSDGMPLLVQAQGVGSGEVLGFGKTDKRINSEFDARSLAARHWRSVKSAKGKVITDAGEQTEPGAVALLRKRAGENDRTESFRRSTPVLDPLSFLLHLRIAPPKQPTVHEVLDGRALWLAKVSAARPDVASPKLLRVDGKLEPIDWGGGADEKRSRYSFSLFLTRDRHHTPVRLVVPFGFGEVRADLVQLDRTEGSGEQLASGGFDCREPRDRPFWRGLTEGWSSMWSASLRRR